MKLIFHSVLTLVTLIFPLSTKESSLAAAPEPAHFLASAVEDRSMQEVLREEMRAKKWQEMNASVNGTLPWLEILAAERRHMVFPTGRSVTPDLKRLKGKYKEFNGHKLLLKRAIRTGLLSLFCREADKRGLPKVLAYIPFVECSLDSFLTSPMYAAGLWQLLESTAERKGITVDSARGIDERFDPVLATQAGLNLFLEIADTIHSWECQYDITLTDANFLCFMIASYNCGTGNVKKLFIETKGCFDSFHFRKKSKEIREYTLKVLALVDLIGEFIEQEYLKKLI